MSNNDKIKSSIPPSMKIFDDLRKSLKPFIDQTIVPPPALQATQQFQDIVSHASQLDSIVSATAPFKTLSQSILEQYHPATHTLENLKAVANSIFPAVIDFPQTNLLPNALKDLLDSIATPIGSEEREIEVAIKELSSYIQEITHVDKDVYIPEELIPDDYSFDSAPERIECKTGNSLSKCSKVRKISPLDAFNIICSLISVLITIIVFLQGQMSPAQEQTQELIEVQREQNELLQKNNKLIQEQIDTTLQTTEYLTNILAELQSNNEESRTDDRETPEPFADEDSGSQLTELNPSESQPESSISPDEPDVPDTY